MVSEQGSQHVWFFPAAWWRKIAIATLIAAAAVIGFLIFQRYFRVAATILLLAALFTYLLQPLVEWLVRASKMKQLHTARVSATLLVYVALAGVLYFTGAEVARVVNANIQDLRDMWATSEQHIPQQVIRLQQWYKTTIPEKIQQEIAVSLRHEMDQASEKYIPTVTASVLGLAKKAGEWIALLIELIFVPLVAFYFLTDGKRVREQALFFIPRRYRSRILRYAREMDRILRRYVHSQLILCVIAWLVITIALVAMGIPGALLLGIIAGVSRAIPVIGPLIGGIPVLAAVLLDPHWAGAFWLVLIGFTVLHFVESKFIMPWILGDHLGVHPVLVIISLLIGYEMLGFVGMFLAPPAIAMVRFILAMRQGDHHTPPTDQQEGQGLSPSLPDENAIGA